MTIYAVNGKEPIAAWIPSLDTAGNGTTTLTDLVGSNNGTLTNMDAATDWVSDTSNGGVRALDFDGVNDYVDTSAQLSGTQSMSLSLWFRTTTIVSAQVAMIGWGEVATAKRIWVGIESGAIWMRFVGSTASCGSGLNDGSWHHIAATKPLDGTNEDVLIWIDNTLQSPVFGGTPAILDIGTGAIAVGRGFDRGFCQFFGDDFRVFDATLDASDIAYLYNSGNGRGVVATTPNTRRRRYTGGYGL